MQKTRTWRIIFLVWITIMVGSVACEAANPIVISQIYTGPLGPYGFIELFNRGTDTVTMNGWTIQASDPNIDSGWTVVPLSGTVGPGQYYLLRVATNISRVSAPKPDADLPLFPIAPGGGQLAIVQDATKLLIPCATVGTFADVEDFISWGSSPCGSQSDPWQDSLAIVRTGGGCPGLVLGTFVLATPSPRNSQSITNICGSASSPSLESFNVPASGGFSATTTGTAASFNGGFARLETAGGTPNPTALAIFGLRQSGTLISEASVPATVPLLSGYFFVDAVGSINTGVAIANMNGVAVNVQYQFIDANSGTTTKQGDFTIPPNAQTAHFMNELPFGFSLPLQGTFLFIASEPISVIALRGNTNARGEFLVTTMPVIDASAPASTAPGFLAHFAVNFGWKTDVILICTGTSPCAGTVSMRDPSGLPVTVKADALVSSSFPYSLNPLGSEKVTLTGLGDKVSGGTIQITPSSGATPISTAVFSFATNNITVSEAGLITPVGTNFRTYVEYSGQVAAVGSIQPGVAIANTAGQATTVALTLTKLDGTATTLNTSVIVPANGQIAKFVNELFPSLSAPFQGVLSLSTTGGPIAVVGLRGHYNERRDFLITTVPAVDQSAPVPLVQPVFPHIVDSGGYTTQFILFGPSGQASNGNIRLFSTGGQPLYLQFK